jgi:hypothetical protein
MTQRYSDNNPIKDVPFDFTELDDTPVEYPSPTGFTVGGEFWTKRLSLTISSSDIDDNISNFPLMIKLTSTAGKTSTDVSDIFDTLGDNSKKIKVVTASGTDCYVEIDTWDSSNEEAVLWVRVPSISSTEDTVLYLYYDAQKADNSDYVGTRSQTPATNVWGSNYHGVWHMNQDPSVSNILDSTTTGLHATPYNMTSADSVDTNIGKGLDLSGSSEYASFGATDISTSYSLSVVFKFNTAAGTPMFMATSSSNYGVVLGPMPGSNYFYCSDTNEELTFSYSSWDTQWHAMHLTRNGTSVKVFVDGTQVDTTKTFSSNNSISPDNFGANYWGQNRAVNGQISEMRLANIALPDAHVAAEGKSHLDNLITYSVDTGTASATRYVAVNAGCTALEFVTASGGGSSDVQTFLDLTDTPSSYEIGKYLVSTSSGVEFTSGTTISGGFLFSDLDDTPSNYLSNEPAELNTDVVLLIQSESTNGSTTFTDSSYYNRTITNINDGITHSTTRSKFGNTSIYFDSSTDYLEVASSPQLDFGNGDFTIDWWEYRPSGSSEPIIDRAISLQYSAFMLGYSGYLVYMSSNGSSWDIASGKTLGSAVIDNWSHLAVVRSGSTFYTFRDGVQQDTWSSSTSLPDYGYGDYGLSIGRAWGTHYFTGYAEEICFTKGVAKWTSNFTAPTAPYSIITSSGTSAPYTKTQFLTINTNSNGLEYRDFDFTQLNDTPTTYSGSEGKYLRVTASGIEFAEVSFGGQSSTLSGTSLFVDGDATVTGTMYAHVYDSYSPLTIRDGGVDVITGNGEGVIDIAAGVTISGVKMTTWTTYSGTPEDTEGNIDDIHLDLTNNNIYKKHYEGVTAETKYNTTSMIHDSYGRNYNSDNVVSNGNQNDAAQWSPPNGTWVSIDLESPIYVSKVLIAGWTSYSTRMVRGFKIQASSNNSDWVDIYEGETINSTSAQTFEFDPPSTAYRYWRCYNLSNWGDASNVNYGRLEFFKFTPGAHVWGDPIGNLNQDLSDHITTDQLATTSGSLQSQIDAAGGVSTFLELTDTPTTYTDAAGKFLISTASGIEFSDYSINSADTDFYGWELVEKIELNGESLSTTVSGIQGDTYDKWFMTWQLSNGTDDGGFLIKFNNDGTSNYYYSRYVMESGGAAAQQGDTSGIGINYLAGNKASSGFAHLFLKSGRGRQVLIRDGRINTGATDDKNLVGASWWKNTADEVTEINFEGTVDEFTGNICLYRWKQVSFPYNDISVTTFSGTSVHVDGDATVTGTMYAHVYDSYSPLTIKDGGVTVISGDGTGVIDFPTGATGIAGTSIFLDSYVPSISAPAEAVAGDYYIRTTDSTLYERLSIDSDTLVSDDFTGTTLNTSKWGTRIYPNASVTQDDALELNNSTGGDHSGAYAFTQTAIAKTGIIKLVCKWMPHTNKGFTVVPPRIAFRNATSFGLDSAYGYANTNYVNILLGQNSDYDNRTQISIQSPVGGTADSASINITEGTWQDLVIILNCSTLEMTVDLNDGDYSLSATLNSTDFNNLGSSIRIEFGDPEVNATSTERFDDVVITRESSLVAWTSLGTHTHTGFATSSHNHTESQITDLDKYTQAEITTISGVLQSQIDSFSGGGSTTFSGLSDTPSSYDEGKYLRSTASGTEWSEISDSPSTFLDLNDTPSAYEEGKFLISTTSGIEFTETALVESNFKAYEVYAEWDFSSETIDETITVDSTDERVVIEFVNCSTSAEIIGRINNDTGNNYHYGYIGQHATVLSAGDANSDKIWLIGSQWDAISSRTEIDVVKTGQQRFWSSHSNFYRASDDDRHLWFDHGYWDNTSSDITSIKIQSNGGATITGKVRVYKFKKVSIPVKPASLTESNFSAYELMKEWSLSNSSIDEVLTINGDVDDVVMFQYDFTSNSDSGVRIQFNSDTGTNYPYWWVTEMNGAVSSAAAASPGSAITLGWAASGESTAGTANAFLTAGKKKTVQSFEIRHNNDAADRHAVRYDFMWNNTATVSGIRVYTDANITGTVRAYKFKKVSLPTVETEANLYRGKQSIKVKWNSTSSFDCLPGNVEIGGTLYNIASTINKSVSSLTASTWYYVYVNPPSTGISLSAANIEYSTTAPTQNTTLMGQYNGSKRCIGAFYSDSSSNIMPFVVSGSRVNYADTIIRVLAAGSASTWTDITFDVPFGDSYIISRVVGYYSDASASLVYRANGFSNTGAVLVSVSSGATSDNVSLELFVDVDKLGEYKWSSANTNYANIDTRGFILPDDIYTGV